jgi:hypothetical protein
LFSASSSIELLHQWPAAGGTLAKSKDTAGQGTLARIDEKTASPGKKWQSSPHTILDEQRVAARTVKHCPSERSPKDGAAGADGKAAKTKAQK